MLKLSDASSYVLKFCHCYKISCLLSWSICCFIAMILAGLVHSQVHLLRIPANVTYSSEHFGGVCWEWPEMPFLPRGWPKEKEGLAVALAPSENGENLCLGRSIGRTPEWTGIIINVVSWLGKTGGRVWKRHQ